MSIISAHMVSISDTREIQLSVMGNAFTRTTPITPHVFTILGTKSFFPVTAAFCINFHWRVIANNPINDAIAKRIKLWIMILGIFLAWILWFNRQNMERDRERESVVKIYMYRLLRWQSTSQPVRMNAAGDCSENTVRLTCLNQKNLSVVIICSKPINYTRMPYKYTHTRTKLPIRELKVECITKHFTQLYHWNMAILVTSIEGQIGEIRNSNL